MEILRIKSTHPESQGEFVEINAEDFDPEKGHELYEPDADGPELTVKELHAELSALGITIPSGARKADLQDMLAAARKE